MEGTIAWALCAGGHAGSAAASHNSGDLVRVEGEKDRLTRLCHGCACCYRIRHGSSSFKMTRSGMRPSHPWHAHRVGMEGRVWRCRRLREDAQADYRALVAQWTGRLKVLTSEAG